MSRHPISSVLCASICLLLLCHPTHANSPAAARSPEAHTELICHTSHASDCYPAIFQPTQDFKQVHDDQSIPPGLHVRLNLATGLKEARLNIPEPDDASKAGLVIIDNLPEQPRNGQQAPLIPEGHSSPVIAGSREEWQEREWRLLAPFGSELGDPFIPSDDPNDPNYNLAKETVLGSRNPQSVLSAIELLTDLVHDLEWGITLTHDAVLSRTLVDYVKSAPPISVDTVSIPLEVRSASAQLLGTALQNNAEALEAFLRHFGDPPGIDWEVWPAPITGVGEALMSSMGGREIDILFQKRLLFLLSNLSPSLPQLQFFAASYSFGILLEVFEGTETEPGVDGRDIIRTKAANYLQDHIISHIDDWPGHSLLELFPPGTSSEILESQSAWRKATRDMEYWCRAFEHAAAKYYVAADVPGGASKEVDNAYMSINESYEMLDKVLQDKGCERGCGCDFERTFASITK